MGLQKYYENGEWKNTFGSTSSALDGMIVVDIPTDYPTLQAAIDDMSKYDTAQGTTIALNIESGHRPSSGISVTRGDYSRFTVTSTDATVLVANDFTGGFISAVYAKAPSLGCLVDMDDKGDDGYSIVDQSGGLVMQYCGVINAGNRGLYINHSSAVNAYRAIFSGSNNRNAWITRASTLNAEEADFSANKGGENAVYVSRASRANILGSNVSNAFQNGIAVIRSFVNAQGCDVSGAGQRGLIAQRGSHVAAEQLIANNCGSHGIMYETGSFGAITSAQASGCTGVGVYIIHASQVNANGVTANNNTTAGIRAETASTINARVATARFNGSMDVQVLTGGVICAVDTVTTNGSPSISNVNVPSFNSISSSGIIWS